MKDFFVLNRNMADLLTNSFIGHNILPNYSNAQYLGFPVVVSDLIENNTIVGFGLCADILRKAKISLKHHLNNETI